LNYPAGNVFREETGFFRMEKMDSKSLPVKPEERRFREEE